MIRQEIDVKYSKKKINKNLSVETPMRYHEYSVIKHSNDVD